MSHAVQDGKSERELETKYNKLGNRMQQYRGRVLKVYTPLPLEAEDMTESPTADSQTDDGNTQSAKIYVRGVGVHGWDGTTNGAGTYEDKDQVHHLSTPVRSTYIYISLSNAGDLTLHLFYGIFLPLFCQL